MSEVDLEWQALETASHLETILTMTVSLGWGRPEDIEQAQKTVDQGAMLLVDIAQRNGWPVRVLPKLVANVRLYWKEEWLREAVGEVQDLCGRLRAKIHAVETCPTFPQLLDAIEGVAAAAAAKTNNEPQYVQSLARHLLSHPWRKLLDEESAKPRGFKRAAELAGLMATLDAVGQGAMPMEQVAAKLNECVKAVRATDGPGAAAVQAFARELERLILAIEQSPPGEEFCKWTKPIVAAVGRAALAAGFHRPIHYHDWPEIICEPEASARGKAIACILYSGPDVGVSQKIVLGGWTKQGDDWRQGRGGKLDNEGRQEILRVLRLWREHVAPSGAMAIVQQAGGGASDRWIPHSVAAAYLTVGDKTVREKSKLMEMIRKRAGDRLRCRKAGNRWEYHLDDWELIVRLYNSPTGIPEIDDPAEIEQRMVQVRSAKLGNRRGE